MTSTEVAVRQPGSVAVTERDIVDGWIQVVGEVGRLADYIAETDFVPKPLRNRPAAIAACILTGRELGIGPMASLKSIHMVQGVPSLSAEYKRARALAAGHQIVIDESNSTRCVVRGRRAGNEQWVTITWTMDHAQRAKINGKDVWRQYPQRMLQARATSELCDLLFPDATLGLETTEVLEDGGALASAVGAEAAAEADAPAEKPAPRTARRARAASADRPTAAAPAAASEPTGAPATAATAPSGPPLPPLPGEEAPGPTQPGSSSAGQSHPPQETSPSSASSPSSSATGPDERDYDSPGTVTTAQLTAIWTIFTKVYGFTVHEKDHARSVAAHIVGHHLGSTREMSKNEAAAVLDTLGNWREIAEQRQETPRDVLVAMMAAGDEAHAQDAAP